MSGTRRRVSIVPAFAALVLLCVQREAAVAQRLPLPAPSDGSSLDGWRVEHTRAELRDGVLRVGKGNGWVRTERVYANFVLSFEMRVPAGRSATVFVRAWPTFDRSSTPTNGYRVKVTGPQAASQTSARWQRLEFECVGGKLTVRADGVVVHTAPEVENPQGHLAFSAPDEAVEVRGIQVRTLPPPAPPAVRPDTFNVGASGVVSPQVLKTAHPRYTADAMRARITGKVTMHAVVLPDGTVTDVVILQALDPHFGIDRAAVEAAKQWIFSPGTRDGQPVAVRIVIELDFNLK